MRPTQRSFVVEYKGGRRRTTIQPNKIWGDTDLKTLVREAEADAPHLFAAAPAPLAVPETKGAPENQPRPTEPVADASPLARETIPGAEGAESQPAPVAEQVHPSDVSPVASRQPQRRRRTVKRSAPSAVDPHAQPTHASAPAAKPDLNDDLEHLETENRRLKYLLTERLRQENDRLRRMLARFA